MRATLLTWGTALLAAALVAAPASAQCPVSTPAQGAPPPAPLPIFPADNWWNLDISTAPVDANSATYLNFIGLTRGLHPDFGGEESPGSQAVYGFPYAVVDGAQPKLPVTFEVWDESDGVDMSTGAGVPFYPVPAQAIAQAHWIEGGAPGTVDDRPNSDRHLLMVDCTNRMLYELYNVWYDGAHWQAYSGAAFDLDANDRRTEGWTSADASGMALFPGLVRYDEASNASLTDLGHAIRVTVRDTNGHVYPASHTAGSRAGAPPMGARLRLKMLVNGQDPVLRTSDPMSRRIFRTMQKYGLIVADNGSDMYISGTFDTRWNNDVLNPAFSLLHASDFEVVELGWNPPPPADAALSSVSASPNPVPGGTTTNGLVALNTTAPAGGITVALASTSGAFTPPANVLVPAGSSNASFPITTTPVGGNTSGTLTASYAGVDKTTQVTVVPAASLSIGDAAVAEGNSGTKSLLFTVKLSAATIVPVSFHAASVNGTASSASADFVALSTDGTIPVGQTTALVSVTLNGDATVEANETFGVQLSAVSGATLADGTGVGYVLNDDGPVLSVGDVTLVEGNAGTKLANVVVSLSQAAAGAVTFNLATANGTATAGSDYVAKTTNGVSIPAGQTSVVFAVTVNGDATVEPNEAFDVLLSAASGATVLDARGTTTLVNDDGPTLSIGDVAIAEGNSGSKLATFTVKLSQAAASAVGYDIRTVLGSAAGGDYTPKTLTGQAIAAGLTSATFTVSVLGDATVEPNETFSVVLSNATNASIGDDTALATILNDDGPTLSIGDLRVGEGNSGNKLVTFAVTLSQAAAVPVTYDIATAAGSATGGSDYVTRALLAQSFPAGQTQRSFAVNVIGDAAAEANEAFTVNLANVSGASVFDGQGVGTILNDDGPTLSVSDASVAEGNAGTGVLTFTVTLSQPTGVPVTFTLATANGNALAGSDYVAKTQGGVSIPAGQQAVPFSVTINGDTAVEPDDVFYLNLSNAVGATVFDSQGAGTITNDD
jgi:hypothetical protein